MSSFGQKIVRFFQRLRGSAGALNQQPYEIACTCGKSVKGIRRNSWIEAECESCFETVFVLPSNVYPSTRRVPSDVLGSFPERLKAAWAELFPPQKPSETADKKKQPKTQDVDEGPLKRNRIRLPSFHPIRWLRSIFTPVRLILLTAICLIAATSYWIVHQRQLQTATQVWRTAPDEIEQLLAELKLAELSQTLQKTVDAGALLNKQDEDWRRYSHLLKEVEGCRLMSPSDFMNCLDAAYDKGGKLQAASAKIVQEKFGGGYFVFDCQPEPANTDQTRFGFGFPGTPDRHGVEFDIVLPQLKQIVQQLNGRILIVARIVSVQAPNSFTDTWHIKIDPNTLALLTQPKIAEFLGMPIADPEIQQQLDAQRAFVETSSPNAASFQDLDGESPLNKERP